MDEKRNSVVAMTVAQNTIADIDNAFRQCEKRPIVDDEWL